MQDIWLIRHGESEGNAGKKTILPSLIKLSQRGGEQSRCIAEYFDTSPSLIVTSSYIRTKQTAEKTIQRFPNSCQEEWDVHEFTYLSPPCYQNTTTEERRGDVERYWKKCDPVYIDGEGAESFKLFMQRVQITTKQLGERQEDFIAIFTHGYFMRALLWLTFFNSTNIINSETMKQFHVFTHLFNISNGSILKLRIKENSIQWFSKIISSHIPFDLLT